ncbi:uncharacterized protein PHALS_11986 [Plasmopara halstedii]|uniref:Uncharacterized protein n=1 Tax=Plasmopara halstedii TaxID=4781 RepID=A0A0P1AL93_PLAHL|nr:uncharacterized protein PHALS_11986 [Plasmopara halstedii]CEG41654.1 hypothetical protein PHALS_11986 [Plasmopara halstedii]|eukprot:XP_024578023.1 hypothetical protein PHALS_11986 [Plasmopara halstedii]
MQESQGMQLFLTPPLEELDLEHKGLIAALSLFLWKEYVFTGIKLTECEGKSSIS